MESRIEEEIEAVEYAILTVKTQESRPIKRNNVRMNRVKKGQKCGESGDAPRWET